MKDGSLKVNGFWKEKRPGWGEDRPGLGRHHQTEEWMSVEGDLIDEAERKTER